MALKDNQLEHSVPIHIYAIKAETKFGLKSNWLQSLDNEQKRYKLGGKQAFGSQILRAKFSREDEVFLTEGIVDW
jgi:hypothetical protein